MANVIMAQLDHFKEKKLEKLLIWGYLIPVFGFFPAVWTLYRNQRNPKEGSSERLKVSRLALTLALIWLLVYVLLSFEAMQSTELLRFRLLFLNGLLTSGYFVTCLGLMFRLWLGKSVRLPGLSPSVMEKFLKPLDVLVHSQQKKEP